MKRIIICAALLIGIFVGCKSTKKQLAQPGVYKMDKITVSGGGKDTIYPRTQFKIYTENHFAYASLAPDSSVGFGVGSYRLDTGNHFVETNIYSSRALDSSANYSVAFNRKDSAYTQKLKMPSASGAVYTMTETYTQLQANGTSKIDGLWKLDKAYIVKGKDTTRQGETQFKAFWGGHFLFVHRYQVANNAAKFKNGFGYGEFTLKNDTLSETEQVTSHATLMGRTFSIKINFKSDDEYSQVITDNQTGEQSVEIYIRLK